MRRGLGAWAVLVVAVLACASSETPPRSGVVLIVLDTLRADRLGAYGNPRDTSPAIDALAERGVVFEQAISFAPWTLPAMIALLSGRIPSQTVYDDGALTSSTVEALSAAGIRTAAFTEGGFVSEAFGLDRGFEVWVEREGKVIRAGGADGEGGPAGTGIGATFEAATTWLAEHRNERFFLLIHSYEAHTPYRRRFFAGGLDAGSLRAPTFEGHLQERIRRGELALGGTELEFVRALYDGGVRVADGYVGRLIDALEETGLSDTTAVIVTSDHGEALGERDPRHLGEHGHALHDEIVQVPLLVVDPLGRYPEDRVSTQVRSLDVLPTVLELLDVEPPAGLRGRSLLPVMRGEEREPRTAFSRVTRKGPPRVAVRDGAFKRVRRLGAGPRQGRLFDLRDDPGERSPLPPRGPEASRLDGLLDGFQRRLDVHGALDFAIRPETVPPELHEQLRALGYLR